MYSRQLGLALLLVAAIASVPASAQFNFSPETVLSLVLTVDANHDACLSPDEVNSLFAGFGGLILMYDNDRDGLVCLTDIAASGLVTREEAYDYFLEYMDKNGDGVATLTEVRTTFATMSLDQFFALDADGDGVISAYDADPTAVVEDPDIILPIDPADLAVVLAMLDTDRSGVVSLAELRVFVPGTTQALFAILDADGSGGVSTGEIGGIGLDRLIALALELIHAVDTDGDYRITVAEASAFAPLAATVFAEGDLNGDGAISGADLLYLDDSIPAGLDELADELVAAILSLDILRDGCIDLDEVRELLPLFPDEAFAFFDINGSGAVCASDIEGISFSEDDALWLGLVVLEAADANGDDALSFAEAQAFLPFVPLYVLEMLDVNGDGVLSLADLDGGVPPIVVDPLDELLRILQQADLDGNLCLSLAEAQTILPSLAAVVLPFIDPNNDGFICLDEAMDFDFDMLEDLLPALIPIVDSDGSGSVSFDEARAIVPPLTRGLFDYLDTNGDGAISASDFGGQEPPVIVNPLDELLEILRQADADGDLCLSLAEAETILHGLAAAAVFPSFDTNGDGQICLDEAMSFDFDMIEDFLVEVIPILDLNRNGSVTVNEMRTILPLLTQGMFDYLDTNGDGVLSPSDFGGEDPPFIVDPLEALLGILQQADADGDFCLSLAEAETILPDLAATVFSLVDPNDDGTLCLVEVGEFGLDMLRDLVPAVISIVDTDGDAAVSFAEAHAFVPLITQSIFDYADTNNDGVLSLADLPGGVVDPPDWPYPPLDNPMALLGWLCERADTNGDGAISFDEAVALVPGLPESLFGTIDTDGDGMLTLSDIQVVAGDDLASRLRALLSQADADQDGVLSYGEVTAVIPWFPLEAFDALDRNDDGVLSLDDLPQGPPVGPHERLLRLLREADADNDGEVTLAEFLLVRPELDADAFNALDLNSDGVLSRADLPGGGIDPIQALLGLIGDADADGDGVVTFEEAQALRPSLTVDQFARLDVNGDGVLSRADLPAIPTDQLRRLIGLLGEADANSDGVVTYDELLAVAPNLTTALFARLDVDGSGGITPDEIPVPPQDPREALLALLREADANRDGSVTLEEAQAVNEGMTADAFAALDANDDGVLTVADMPDAPVPLDETLRRQLLAALVGADANNNGELDYSEIAAAFPDAPAELLAAIDTDHNWSLSRYELTAVLAVGESGAPIVSAEDVDCDGAVTSADIQLVINQALGLSGDVLPIDVDGNGYIDAVDVQKVINRVLQPAI